MSMWTSKLGNKYAKEEIERMDRDNHRVLERLRKEPANARCAECREPGVMWASVNLGVFVCVRCADIHRALGTHISKVKGCTGTYLWGPDEIESMQAKGNAWAERCYGSAVPSASASKEERIRMAERKYQNADTKPSFGQALEAPMPEPVVEQKPVATAAPTARRVPVAVPAASQSDLLSRPLAPPPSSTSYSRKAVAAAAKPSVDLIDFEDLCGCNESNEKMWQLQQPASKASGIDEFLAPCFQTPGKAASPSAPIKPADLSGLWADFGSW